MRHATWFFSLSVVASGTAFSAKLARDRMDREAKMADVDSTCRHCTSATSSGPARVSRVLPIA
jgi:hypothetical protein